MNRTIENRVIESVSNELCVPISMVSRDSRLKEDLGADSIDIIEIAMDIEEHFGVMIDEETESNFKTVNDIITHLEKLS